MGTQKLLNVPLQGGLSAEDLAEFAAYHDVNAFLDEASSGPLQLLFRLAEHRGDWTREARNTLFYPSQE